MSWLTKHFQALVQRAGLGWMRLQTSAMERRAYWSGQASIRASPQELLRHASRKTTMEIYSYVSARAAA